MIRCPNCNRLYSNIVRKCSICGTDFFENEVPTQRQMAPKHAMVQQNNENSLNIEATQCKKIRCVLLVNTSSVMKPYKEELNEQIRVFVETWKEVLEFEVVDPELRFACYEEKCKNDVELTIILFDKEARTLQQETSIATVAVAVTEEHIKPI